MAIGAGAVVVADGALRVFFSNDFLYSLLAPPSAVPFELRSVNDFLASLVGDIAPSATGARPQTGVSAALAALAFSAPSLTFNAFSALAFSTFSSTSFSRALISIGLAAPKGEATTFLTNVSVIAATEGGLDSTVAGVDSTILVSTGLAEPKGDGLADGESSVARVEGEADSVEGEGAADRAESSSLRRWGWGVDSDELDPSTGAAT